MMIKSIEHSMHEVRCLRCDQVASFSLRFVEFPGLESQRTQTISASPHACQTNRLNGKWWMEYPGTHVWQLRLLIQLYLVSGVLCWSLSQLWISGWWSMSPDIVSFLLGWFCGATKEGNKAFERNIRRGWALVFLATLPLIACYGVSCSMRVCCWLHWKTYPLMERIM